MKGCRTDLAAEELPQGGGQLPGVKSQQYQRDGFLVTDVEVLDARGEKSLCKPTGRYVTMDVTTFFHREEDSFPHAAQLLADCIRELMPLQAEDSVLVAGLGNPAITPDAVGPMTTASTLATRHLKAQMPEDFSLFRPVSVCQTGVLGTTGMESAELIHAIAGAVSPHAIVVIDALAARSSEKLCRTVQLADSGIVPGSGVGNDRAELSRRLLGVPVLAVGVPTVVDAGDGLIVTPRNIDKYVKDAGKLIAYALNLAFHPGLTVTDVDMFVG
ncbi:MAG: GPR endopeptidase [Oscillospiraceae bacterium]|nr:GPR endopeptidase [Oscillospiraceae bacterium]